MKLTFTNSGMVYTVIRHAVTDTVYNKEYYSENYDVVGYRAVRILITQSLSIFIKDLNIKYEHPPMISVDIDR